MTKDELFRGLDEIRRLGYSVSVPGERRFESDFGERGLIVDAGFSLHGVEGIRLETDIVATVLEDVDGIGPADERPSQLVSIEDARSRG